MARIYTYAHYKLKARVIGDWTCDWGGIQMQQWPLFFNDDGALRAQIEEDKLDAWKEGVDNWGNEPPRDWFQSEAVDFLGFKVRNTDCCTTPK